jgi:hypothetical protein
MEIGIAFFFGLLGIAVWFSECTKIGQRLTNYLFNKFCDIDLDELED